MKKRLLTGMLIAITTTSTLWLSGTAKGGQVDPEQAMGTYSYIIAQEANNGDSDSQNTLAKMYMLGINIPPK